MVRLGVRYSRRGFLVGLWLWWWLRLRGSINVGFGLWFEGRWFRHVLCFPRSSSSSSFSLFFHHHHHHIFPILVVITVTTTKSFFSRKLNKPKLLQNPYPLPPKRKFPPLGVVYDTVFGNGPIHSMGHRICMVFGYISVFGGGRIGVREGVYKSFYRDGTLVWMDGCTPIRCQIGYDGPSYHCWNNVLV